MPKKSRVNSFRPDGGKRGIISATLFLSRPPPLLKKYDLLQMWQEGRIPFFCVKKRCKNTLHLSMPLFRQCGIAQIPDIPSAGV